MHYNLLLHVALVNELLQRAQVFATFCARSHSSRLFSPTWALALS